MEIAITGSPSSRQSVMACRAVAGAFIEVADLEATRTFYGAIFADRAGDWLEEGDRLAFRSPEQTLTFVRRSEPRSLPETGQHQAYRVRSERLEQLVQQLMAAGRSVDRWREDHPSERALAPYVQDPSGNRVQLVGHADPARPLDHVGIEVHDLETAEVFYVKVLGGIVDYYHGRRVHDYVQAAAWGEGSDPCAPWTRLWPGPGLSTNPRHKARASHPNQQAFVRFGDTVVALILASKHRQEPPEELVRGTPRLVLRTDDRVSDVPPALARPPVSLRPEERLRLSFEQEGESIFLRDPAGNFVEVICER